MFTDEVGDKLVEVKKYDEAEPIRTPEPEPESAPLAADETCDDEFDDKKIQEVEESFNNVENVRYIESLTVSAKRRENINLKIFGNPNIRKSQSWVSSSRGGVGGCEPRCPAPSPLASPAPSPRLVHRPRTLISMEQAPRCDTHSSHLMIYYTIT